jgi:hypothetical protein
MSTPFYWNRDDFHAAHQPPPRRRWQWLLLGLLVLLIWCAAVALGVFAAGFLWSASLPELASAGTLVPERIEV